MNKKQMRPIEIAILRKLKDSFVGREVAGVRHKSFRCFVRAAEHYMFSIRGRRKPKAALLILARSLVNKELLDEQDFSDIFDHLYCRSSFLSAVAVASREETENLLKTILFTNGRRFMSMKEGTQAISKKLLIVEEQANLKFRLWSEVSITDMLGLTVRSYSEQVWAKKAWAKLIASEEYGGNEEAAKNDLIQNSPGWKNLAVQFSRGIAGNDPIVYGDLSLLEFKEST